MKEDLKQKSTIELIKQMTLLERNIDLQLHIYNKIVRELYERIPTLEQQEEIKPKVLIKEKIDLRKNIYYIYYAGNFLAQSLHYAFII